MNEYKRFVTSREWGNKFTLYDRELNMKHVEGHKSKEYVDGLANFLNIYALDCTTAEQVQQKIGRKEKDEQDAIDNLVKLAKKASDIIKGTGTASNEVLD